MLRLMKSWVTTIFKINVKIVTLLNHLEFHTVVHAEHVL